MFALTAITETRPFPTRARSEARSGARSAATPRSAPSRAEVVVPIAPGETWGREAVGPLAGRSTVAVVVRSSTAGLLEVASLVIDAQGFGALRLRLLPSASAREVAAELSRLGEGGEPARLLAHDGSPAARAVVQLLEPSAIGLTTLAVLRRFEVQELGLSRIAREAGPWRARLVEDWASGDGRAEFPLCEEAEADCFSLLCWGRRVAAPRLGALAA